MPVGVEICDTLLPPDIIPERKFDISITDTDGAVEGNKRQYAPAVLRWKCAKCGEGLENDYRKAEYISYPKIVGATNDDQSSFETVTLWCPSCQHEQEIKVRLRMTLEVTEER